MAEKKFTSEEVNKFKASRDLKDKELKEGGAFQIGGEGGLLLLTEDQIGNEKREAEFKERLERGWKVGMAMFFNQLEGFVKEDEERNSRLNEEELYQHQKIKEIIKQRKKAEDWVKSKIDKLKLSQSTQMIIQKLERDFLKEIGSAYVYRGDHRDRPGEDFAELVQFLGLSKVDYKYYWERQSQLTLRQAMLDEYLLQQLQDKELAQ